MSKYYGIYLKGKVKEPLDLTKLTNFERSGNLKSNKLYTLKELIKLTTKYDDEIDFKIALFYSGIIELNDIERGISIRGMNEGKLGKSKDIVYKPCIDLFRPQVIKDIYLNRTSLPRDYDFLEKLINEFTPYGLSYDIGRHTGEIFLEEINNILINHNPEYCYEEQLRGTMNDFINHKMYFVLGEGIPNGYDRKISYRYRMNGNNKMVDLHSLYKLVLFYIHNGNDKSFKNGKATEEELTKLKIEIEKAILERQQAYDKYVKEALALAEQDRIMFSDATTQSKHKSRVKKLKNDINGQLTIKEDE